MVFNNFHSEKKRILITRHTDVFDTFQDGKKYLYGNLDGFWLSELGIRQAKETGKFIKEELKLPLELVVFSPRERTFQTAQIIVDMNGATPAMKPDERLKDIGVFPWQGKLPREEWNKNRNHYWELQNNPPNDLEGLEHPERIQYRMVEAFNYYEREHPNKNLLFVSHGDPICFLLQHFRKEQRQPLTHYSLGINKGALFEIIKESDYYIVEKLFEPKEKNTIYPIQLKSDKET